MITWDDAITICQKKTNDSSSDSLTYLKLMMNVGYKTVLSKLNRAVTEKTKTAVTVADQQYYQAPSDLLWIKSLTISDGSTVYPIMEEEAQENWEYLNMTTQTSTIPRLFYVRPGFGINGLEFGLFPIPSTSDYTVYMTYASNDKDLSVDAYTTGTVTLTSGSADVVGIGTTFTSAMIGRYLKPTSTSGDGMWYKVSARSGNEAITLENVFEGTTHTGTYQICEIFALPEDIQMLPVDFALWHYFSGKGNKDKMSEHFNLYTAGLQEAKRTYAKKTSNPIIRSSRGYSRGYPSNFPTSIT